jgi:hypothetical protein
MTTQAQTTGNTTVNAPKVNGAPTQPTVAELMARIAELEAAQQAGISYKCYAAGETYTDGQGKQQTGKGVMSMSGLGKFPVSLYESQWRRLIAEVKSGNVETALAKFKGKLAVKSAK